MNLIKRLYKRQKTAAHALQDLVDGLKAALPANLRSVIVFGSFASGEFQEGRSNANVMVLVEPLDVMTLDQLKDPIRTWMEAGHPAPVIAGPRELPDMAHVLPIEFCDILDYHRVVFGDSALAAIRPDPARLRIQAEHDLTILLLRLRRGAVESPDPKALGGLVAESLSSAWTLCRALLRAQGAAGSWTKVEAARRLSADAGLDRGLIDRLEACRAARDFSEGAALFPGYMELIEKLLHYAGSLTSSPKEGL